MPASHCSAVTCRGNITAAPPLPTHDAVGQHAADNPAFTVQTVGQRERRLAAERRADFD